MCEHIYRYMNVYVYFAGGMTGSKPEINTFYSV